MMTMHLQHAWRRAGMEGIDRHLAVARERAAFSIVCMLDPTGGRYHSWLSAWRRRHWERHGLLSSANVEQHRRTGLALRRFVEALPHLSRELRDAGRYRNADELLDAAASADALGSFKAERRARERSQTSLIVEEAGWRVVRLDGPDAARRFGWGTRWCTSSDGEFDQYRMRGELFGISTPYCKYQFSTGTGEFRDAADVLADYDALVAQAPPSVLEALTKLRHDGLYRE